MVPVMMTHAEHEPQAYRPGAGGVKFIRRWIVGRILAITRQPRPMLIHEPRISRMHAGTGPVPSVPLIRADPRRSAARRFV
jgi:hypothetical protein